MKLAIRTFAILAALALPVIVADQAFAQGRGGFGRGFDMDALAERLNLDQAQRESIERIVQEQIEQNMSRFAEMRGEDGQMDFEKMREVIEELRTETNKKVREILRPDQQAEFDKYVEEQTEQMREWMDRGRNWGRRSTTDRVLGQLDLSDAEASVLRPMIEKVEEMRTEARQATERARRELIRAAGDEQTDADKVRESLVEYRRVRDDWDARVRTAREELREVLTLRQEAVLVGSGLLD